MAPDQRRVSCLLTVSIIANYGCLPTIAIWVFELFLSQNTAAD